MKLLSIFLAIGVLLVIRVDADQCSSLSNCRSCAQEPGCGWCAASSTCVEGTVAGPTTTNLTAPCVNAVCWLFGNNTQCPEDCNSIDICSECEATPNCFWCGSTHQCLLSKNHVKYGIALPCGAQCGDDSLPSCWKMNSTDQNFQGNCPTVPYCNNLTNCRDCTEANCYWCGLNEQCMESTAWGFIQPCGFEGESCSDPHGGVGCFFGTPSLCPRNHSRCNALSDCTSCVNAGCGWCLEGKHCSECGDPCQNDPNTCYIMNYADMCPGVVGNKTVPCSIFNGNCTACLSAQCGYCQDTNLCIESNGAEQCQTNVTCNAFINLWQMDQCDVPYVTNSTDLRIHHNNNDRKAEEIVGGVVAGVVGAAFIVGLVLFLRHRRGRHHHHHEYEHIR